MEFPIIKTNRCQLRQAVKEDASWMIQLFNDKDVVQYIEGIKWFNADVLSVESFIASMESNHKDSNGILWCVICQNNPAGIIMVNDLTEDPYLTFALFKEYREHGLGTEIYNAVKDYVSKKFTEPTIETNNPIVRKITKRECEYLFIDNHFVSSVQELQYILSHLKPIEKSYKSIIEEVLAAFRDGSLTNWLFYLGQNGDENALNIANALNGLSKDAGDRNLISNISKILNKEDTFLNNDVKSLIRIYPTATLYNIGGEYDVNIYEPINLECSNNNWQVIFTFEILQSRHDLIDIVFCGIHKRIHLSRKEKIVKLTFPISLKETEEENFNIEIDGTIFHTLKFQMYPQKEWDNDTCTLQGVRHLYMQEYKKSLLCFSRYKSAADLFWLGIMEYIGTHGDPNPRDAFLLFEQASSHGDHTWSYIADIFKAIMTMKGEGVKGDFEKAAMLISKYPDSAESIGLFQDAFSGKLKDIDYDSIFYRYNISDNTHMPKVFAIQNSCISPKYLRNTCSPFVIVINKELSSKIKQTLSENDTLHAYIGVSTANNGDWQYVIEKDWITNEPYNTFIYDQQSRCYGLQIDNLNIRQHILPNEKILKINLILRNSDGTKQFPSDGTYYAINCLMRRSYIALCNLSSLFQKFSAFRAMCHSLNLTFENIN